MPSKSTNTEFYLTQLKRIVKKVNAKISKKAIVLLAQHLETHAKFIIKRAKYFAKKNRRKIIKEEDIKNSIKEGILLET